MTWNCHLRLLNGVNVSADVDSVNNGNFTFCQRNYRINSKQIREKRKRIQFLSPVLIKFSVLHSDSETKYSILSSVRNISFFHLLLLGFLFLILTSFYSYNDPLWKPCVSFLFRLDGGVSILLETSRFSSSFPAFIWHSLSLLCSISVELFFSDASDRVMHMYSGDMWFCAWPMLT